MNTKTWIIFGVVVAVVLGGLIAVSKKDQAAVDGIDITKIQTASEASGNIADQVYGNKDSKVTIIEYGDFQCPGCATAYPILKDLSNEYKDKIAFVFRNNPLPAIHPNAKSAAAAAEAAGLQGKYWEMHDLLYEQQQSWGSVAVEKRVDTFVNYAKTVGVMNLEKFKTDLGSEAVNKKINFDLALGKKAEVSGTPTILVNNKKLEGETWSDKAKFKQVIEDALR